MRARGRSQVPAIPRTWAIRAIIRTARRLKTEVYLVGGPFRDILLGCPLLDIDIAIETEVDRFGQALARELNGTFKQYLQFGTGTVEFRGQHIDIARTRTERYSAPARLPRVKHADILADLVRRDFTINAMAWRLTPGARAQETMGRPQFAHTRRLVDPFGGMKDLRQGVIRVLHERSFVDDPTRIFRAVRFAERFGFRLAPGTARLMQDAIRQGFLRLLSGKRVLTELELIMKSPDSIDILRALNRRRVFASLWGVSLTRDCFHNLKLLFPVGVERPGTTLTYLLSCFPDTGNLPLTREQRADISSLRRFPMIREGLAKTGKPSRVYEMLKPFSRHALYMLTWFEPATALKIHRFLAGYADVAPLLKGRDLKSLGLKPGPAFAVILEQLRAARLDGKVKTRGDEIALARRLAAEHKE